MMYVNHLGISGINLPVLESQYCVGEAESKFQDP